MQINSIFFTLSEVTNAVIFLAIPEDGINNVGIWSFKTRPNIVSNDVVKFPLIKLNVGGGYDNNTGVFTCPSDGYYAVHWSVATTDDSNRCSSAVMKNGVAMIGNEIGGNLATFHMNRNDRAWIRATSNCTVLSYHSSFSGFKIL